MRVSGVAGLADALALTGIPFFDPFFDAPVDAAPRFREVASVRCEVPRDLPGKPRDFFFAAIKLSARMEGDGMYGGWCSGSIGRHAHWQLRLSYTGGSGWKKGWLRPSPILLVVFIAGDPFLDAQSTIWRWSWRRLTSMLANASTVFLRVISWDTGYAPETSPPENMYTDIAIVGPRE